jgi:hypothetical protein
MSMYSYSLKRFLFEEKCCLSHKYPLAAVKRSDVNNRQNCTLSWSLRKKLIIFITEPRQILYKSLFFIGVHCPYCPPNLLLVFILVFSIILINLFCVCAPRCLISFCIINRFCRKKPTPFPPPPPPNSTLAYPVKTPLTRGENPFMLKKIYPS